MAGIKRMALAEVQKAKGVSGGKKGKADMNKFEAAYKAKGKKK